MSASDKKIWKLPCNILENTRFNPYGHGNKVYWSKAATECLAGEVYLVEFQSNLLVIIRPMNRICQRPAVLKNVESNYGLSIATRF